jgi:hypothetical protein
VSKFPTEHVPRRPPEEYEPHYSAGVPVIVNFCSGGPPKTPEEAYWRAVSAVQNAKAQRIIDDGLKSGRFVRGTELMPDRPIRVALLPCADEER